MHTRQSLENDLAVAGFTSRDTVLIHSSMRSIGSVDGGVDSVLDALCSFFRDGLIVFPSFSYASVSEETNPVFSRRDTPACTGILSEFFRRRPGVFRSLHPLHSLAAYGKDAVPFIADHEKYSTAFDEGSPWGRLAGRNGKLLFIGVTLDCATYFHAVEQWAGVKVLSETPLSLFSDDGDRQRYPVTVYWHTGGHSEQYHCAEDILRQNRLIRYAVFGDAPVKIIECRPCRDFLIKFLRQHPDFFVK